jgi:hypothetical protein
MQPKNRPLAKAVGLGVIALVVLAQFIPVNRKNPAIDPSKTIFTVYPMPPNVRAVFETSCQDCHSDATRWPWYSRVAPISWVVANDVHAGRRNFNFSEWVDYSAKRKEHKLDEICEQITDGNMPDTKYVLIHRTKKLTLQQKNAVCEWTQSVNQN